MAQVPERIKDKKKKKNMAKSIILVTLIKNRLQPVDMLSFSHILQISWYIILLLLVLNPLWDIGHQQCLLPIVCGFWLLISAI